MSISSFQLAEILARTNRRAALIKTSEGTGVPVEREQDLHDQIHQLCRERGWIPFHGSMAHRTHRTEAEPDFIIFADGSRVFAIECKSRLGKLSPAQRALIAWAAKLGHTVHVVRSMAEFREAVK